MGQYYKIVNPAKKEYLNPSSFGDGLKLQDFGNGSFGTMFALALLLSSGNNQGGGDLSSNDPLIGSWAGDPIYILGDYSDKMVEISGIANVKNDTLNTMLYKKKYKFKDISLKTIKLIANASKNQHPLAYIANIKDINSSMRPKEWAIADHYIEPNKKSILSFTQLMKVLDAEIGESEEITTANLAWKWQCLYGFFHNQDKSFQNSSKGRMEILSIAKISKQFNFDDYVLWEEKESKIFKSMQILAGRDITSYISEIKINLKNTNNNKQYETDLIFPCSIMDLKNILDVVLNDNASKNNII